MRILRRFTALLAFLIPLVPMLGFGRTYYIDYQAGSDSNNGTAKEAAWKRAPGMKGFAASYSHSAGDRFIFKGGVTWPAACFQWQITTGGSSTASRDYYGADTSWYSGAAFSRPLFDFQHTILGPNGTLAAGVLVDGANHITFDNLELANLRIPLEKPGVSIWGSTTICLNNVNYFTLTNSLVRDWDQPTVNGSTPTKSGGGGGIMRVNNGINNVVTHCEFHQLNVAAKNGTAVWNIGEASDSHFHHTCSVFHYGQVFRNNWVHDLVDPSDPDLHSNVILCPGGVLVYNNLIHDIAPRAQIIFIAPGYYGAGTDLIYNNVVYNVAQPCIAIDTDGQNNQAAGSRIYNNTLVGPGGNGYCLRVIYRSTGSFPLLDFRNNHLITSGTAMLYNNPQRGGAQVASMTLASYVTHDLATAASLGFTPANRFAPASDRVPTVRTGLDLSTVFQTDLLGSRRPSGAWDVGAYQYSGTTPPVQKANSAPVIAPIQSSVADASATDAGLQVVEGASVTLSSSIADADNDAVTWTWTQTDEHGTTTTVASGSGTSPSVTYRFSTAGKKFTWKLRATDGQASSEASLSIQVLSAPAIMTGRTLAIEAEATSLTAPFTVLNGSVSQSIQTSLNQGGRATYTFSVPTAGTYVVSGLVKASSEGANSFFINIDAEPTDPTSIWHVPVTSGFEQRTVTWENAASASSTEAPPKYFQLTAGQHTLIVVGREPGAQLDRFTITRLPASPRNLRVVASGS